MAGLIATLIALLLFCCCGPILFFGLIDDTEELVPRESSRRESN